MWWHNALGSIPFLLIIFMLLRHINMERDAHSRERGDLIARIRGHEPAQPDQSFIPLDDPRIRPMIDHLQGRHAGSTVGDVEGTEIQP